MGSAGRGRGCGRRSRALVAGVDAVGAAGPARTRVMPEALAGARCTAFAGAAVLSLGCLARAVGRCQKLAL